MLNKVQISFAFLLLFISLVFFVPQVFGGANDKWKDCCASGCTYLPGSSVSIGTTYYCCCVDSTASWTTSSCSYPKDVSYCNKAGATYFADKQNSDCTYSDRDNICRSSAFASGCTAAPECNGITANTNIAHCGCGKTYFADKCNSTCGCADVGDNICRSSSFASDCTADSACNGKKPGDSCGTGKQCDSSCKCIQTVVVVACYSDSDCNDNNPCTTDTCVNPGTTSAYCTHSNKPDGTSCPDDGNPCTNDYCSSGSCIHPNKPDGTDCGDCKVCSSGSCVDKPKPSCTICQDLYCNAATDTWYCANKAAGTSCGTCKQCDGSGNCVNRPDGYNDCGPGCQRCVSGACKDYNPACEGTASSCYCSNDVCIACPSSGCCDATCSAYVCGLTPNNAKCPSGQMCNPNCQCVAALGSIAGTVKDSSGNPIAGVSISVSGPSSGSTSTDNNGYYIISNLNPGSYTVTASIIGYNSQSKSASVSAGSTTTVNFDLTPFCDYDNVCDSGETQACSDCKTIVSIYPTYTYPGQEVVITVYFTDSRFSVSKSDYDVKFDLFISNIPWNSTNGCDIGSKKLRSEMNCGCGMGGCTGKHGYYKSSEYWIDLSNGYAKITATCKIPSTIPVGSHTFKAIPVIYSSPTPLNPGEAVFEVANPLEKVLVDLQTRIISFLRRITGLFILR
jgi:hypothetical protein